MKKITLLCFAFFALAFTFNSNAQCTWTIELTDSFGDSWNGVSTMDVLVNGTVVLDDIAVTSGSADTFNFTVNDGDDITTVFNPAATAGAPDWAQECGYRILDLNGNEVYNANFGAPAPNGAPDDLLSGQVTGSCAACTAPVVDTASILLGAFDCDVANTFSFTLEMDDLGGASTVTVTNDAGVPSVDISVIDTPIIFSGFPTDTDITLTFVDDEATDCNVVVGPIRFDCPPENDLFANAIAVSCGSIVNGNTVNATQDEADAPSDATVEEDTPADNDSPWVWYSFTGSGESEVITLSTCGVANTDFDTEIFVYTGTSGNLTLIDDGYDECGGFTENFAAETSFTSDGTTTYYIAVGGWNESNVGNFQLSVSCTTLSDNSFESESAFTYYPNPVNNKLTLNAVNNIQNVAVYNMLGQEVMRATPNNVDGELDMSSLQTGAYFVKVTINDVTETIRIIKQ